jgi:hypothetical protein
VKTTYQSEASWSRCNEWRRKEWKKVNEGKLHRRWLSYWVLRHLHGFKFTDFSEDRRPDDRGSKDLRNVVKLFNSLYGAVNQQTAILFLAAVRTSNPTLINAVLLLDIAHSVLYIFLFSVLDIKQFIFIPFLLCSWNCTSYLYTLLYLFLKLYILSLHLSFCILDFSTG